MSTKKTFNPDNDLLEIEIRKSVGPNPYEYINFSGKFNIETALQVKGMVDLACEDLAYKPNSNEPIEIPKAFVKSIPNEPLAESAMPEINNQVQGEVKCVSCQGKVWDNSGIKTDPSHKFYNPDSKGPDYKCRDKACDKAAWKQDDGSLSWSK